MGLVNASKSDLTNYILPKAHTKSEFYSRVEGRRAHFRCDLHQQQLGWTKRALRTAPRMPAVDPLQTSGNTQPSKALALRKVARLRTLWSIR